MIVQSCVQNGKTDFTFTVGRQNYQEAWDLINKNINVLDAKGVEGDHKVAKVSHRWGRHAFLTQVFAADYVLKTLACDGINVQAITTSEIKVSVLISEKYLELAVRSLHSAFNLAEASIKRVTLC